jgi:hypothetical protein
MPTAPPGEPGGALFDPPWAGSLGFLDLSGLLAATFPVVFKYEGNLVALVEGQDTSRFEGGGMDEDVLPAGLRLYEAKALSRVEELYCTCGSHLGVPSRSGVMTPV